MKPLEEMSIVEMVEICNPVEPRVKIKNKADLYAFSDPHNLKWDEMMAIAEKEEYEEKMKNKKK